MQTVARFKIKSQLFLPRPIFSWLSMMNHFFFFLSDKRACHVTKIFLNWNFTFFLEKHWKYKVSLKSFHKTSPLEFSFWLPCFIAKIPFQTKTYHRASSLTNQDGARTWEIILSSNEYKTNFNLIKWKGFTNGTKQFLCKINLYYKCTNIKAVMQQIV